MGVMISSLTIEGYRCFEHFEMSGLGRVNLLVGKNNSGKTSVLEAIFLLMSQGDPLLVWQLLLRRGETLVLETPGSPPTAHIEVDTNHLFTGHQIRVGSKLRLSASHESTTRNLSLRVASLPVNGASSGGRS